MSIHIAGKNKTATANGVGQGSRRHPAQTSHAKINAPSMGASVCTLATGITIGQPTKI